MSLYKGRNTNPFLMMKYPGFNVILNGAFLKELLINAHTVALPNMRYPFFNIAVCRDEAYPVIFLDRLLGISDRDFNPFYLFIKTAKHNICVNTSRLPVIFYEYDLMIRVNAFSCFYVYDKDGSKFIEFIPDELYNAKEGQVAKISELINGDGGTGI